MGLLKVFPVLRLCAFLAGVNGGSVLVWPAGASHFLNMIPVLDALMDRGHRVTVLVPSAALHRDVRQAARFDLLFFNVSVSDSELRLLLEDFLRFSIHDMERASLLHMHAEFYRLYSRKQDLTLSYCEGTLRYPPLMEQLRRARFDAVLADPVYPCGDLMAHALGVPFVYTFRFSIAHTVERLCGASATPPAYVPGAISGFTDRMSFTQRVRNVLFYWSQDAMAVSLWRKYDQYYSQYLGKPTSYCEMMGRADIWLIRAYWDFEFPRPLLPNFIYVGGLHCTPAEPLPKDMEEFVQSSGDDGVVVFTLGTLITNLTMEKSNMIASALGQIPQKVVWSYRGEKPDTLAPNTRIYCWIPQNDLLGHPKTRAFVTHGGSNSLYQAIYHGVPMVGIPLFADQPDNMVHVQAKGVAIVLDFSSMQTQDLVDALTAIIHQPEYKASARRLSQIHHERPVKPLDEAVFWIEYVMRNKGAKHLRVAAHHLTWYQYYLLDVLSFFILILALILYIFIKICRVGLWLIKSTLNHKRKLE
ncbi:hypothetical protein PHYPO_G00138040 [Pangasianodon hypophthalmus]|uniref:UDP-glucuronosyltransferase n=1 Tax=Pangasianodon hypophthalmus TaxID=310915 RepID=A0A5N5KCN0_PANHP|nr:hypothetical protein PHYPO_G00138040 [Pangasianodon hypophthalmus]